MEQSAAALDQLYREVSQSLCTEPVAGDALFARSLHPYFGSVGALTDNTRLPTMLPYLDELLGGGFEVGEVVHIAGPHKSGKTLLVFYALLVYLLRNPQRSALYIHTSQMFSPNRCLDILHVLIDLLRATEGTIFLSTVPGQEDQVQEWRTTAISVLERLDICNTVEAAVANVEIDAALQKLDQKCSIIVIDSLSTLLGGRHLSAVPIQGSFSVLKRHIIPTDACATGQCNLAEFVARLTRLARTPAHPLTIFVSLFWFLEPYCPISVEAMWIAYQQHDHDPTDSYPTSHLSIHTSHPPQTGAGPCVWLHDRYDPLVHTRR